MSRPPGVASPVTTWRQRLNLDESLPDGLTPIGHAIARRAHYTTAVILAPFTAGDLATDTGYGLPAARRALALLTERGWIEPFGDGVRLTIPAGSSTSSRFR